MPCSYCAKVKCDFCTQYERDANYIKKCNELEECHKRDFFDAVQTIDATIDNIENLFNQRKLIGKNVSSKPKVVGRLIHKSFLAENEQQSVGGALNGDSEIEKYIKYINEGDIDKARGQLFIVKKKMGDKMPIGRYVIWVFYKGKGTPFAGENLDEMPCRLGLSGEEGGEPNPANYFPVEIHLRNNAAKVPIKKPTPFDAGPGNENWHPGGMTQPTAACAGKAKGGFWEAVMPGTDIEIGGAKPGAPMIFELVEVPQL